jgi:hypothetical protein
MSGAVPLLPQYAFMAWCLVKAQGQLYLYLLFDNDIYHNCVIIYRFVIGWRKLVRQLLTNTSNKNGNMVRAVVMNSVSVSRLTDSV